MKQIIGRVSNLREQVVIFNLDLFFIILKNKYINQSF